MRRTPGVVFQDLAQMEEDTSFQQLSAFLRRRLFNKLLQDKGSNSTRNSIMKQEISETKENARAHLNGYLERQEIQVMTIQRFHSIQERR